MRPCPFCKSINQTMVYDTMAYAVHCNGCGAYGPRAGWRKDAEDFWDAIRIPDMIVHPLEYPPEE